MKNRKPKTPPHPKLYHTVTKYHEKNNWRKHDFSEQLSLRKPGRLKNYIKNNWYLVHCVELYSGEVVASNFDLPLATWYQVTAFPIRDAALRGEHHEAGMHYLRRRVEQAQRPLNVAIARSTRIAELGKQISGAREQQHERALAEEKQEKQTQNNERITT